MTETRLQIPAKVSAEVDHLELTVEGPNGSVTRRLWYPDVSVTVEDGEVVIASDADDAETVSTIGTFESHVENMFYGVTDGWEYEMEVFYSHFPMQVTVEGSEVVIENFLGERASSSRTSSASGRTGGPRFTATPRWTSTASR
jgi:large subunit ribosomal protein L6